jgi:hypothetical protein
MFETLFGSEMPMAARFFIAFMVVLALIGLTAWLVRRFGANRLGGASARGRQPRLAVIDAASVDGRRRLILIRRDNVEHLLMIGGPTDVVVEQNIVRAAATSRDIGRDTGRDTGREPPRMNSQNDGLPRAVPLGDVGGWPLQPEPTPVQAPLQTQVQAPAPRSYRPAVTEEPWVAPEQPTRNRTPDNQMPSEFSARPNSDVGAPAARPSSPVAAPAREPTAADPAKQPQTDHNLAEMAQRLEAALRRPGAGDLHPPVTDPLAASLAAPTSFEPPRTAAREMKPMRAEPKFEPKLEPKLQSKPEPKFEPKPAAGKTAYDSLEQEMANLLGRPSGKT